MTYRVSELTEVVTIQEETESKDGAGGLVTAWQDLRKEYALVRPLSGGERMGADRTELISGYLVVIRTRQDVNEKHRIVWRGRAMNIRFPKIRKFRSLFLELECSVGVAV